MHTITKNEDILFSTQIACLNVRASLEGSKRQDDTGDIKHLILKVSLVKGLGGLFLICFVRRVYFGALILFGCLFTSHYHPGLVRRGGHKHRSR